MSLRLKFAFCLALAGFIPGQALSQGLLTHERRSASPPEPLCRADRAGFLNEGFEGDFPPLGWAVIHLGDQNTWDQTDDLCHSGKYSAWVHYGDIGILQDEWLVSPPLNLSDASHVMLEFYEEENYWSDYGTHHAVLVSTTVQDDPGAFGYVEQWFPWNHAINGFDGDPLEVDLSDYAGEPLVYVAFRYEGEYADDWFIDDVRVYEPYVHDVMAVAALPDGEQYPGGASITPQGIVENPGLSAESFTVSMEIHSGGATHYSETVPVDFLLPGQERSVEFPVFILEQGNYYELVLSTHLPTDENPGNDQATGLVDTYTQPHVPLGLLFTNSGCGPCVVVNLALDGYLEMWGDALALLRVHVWWPFGGDVMWLANQEQNGALIEAYGVSGVPHFFADGLWDLGHYADGILAGLDEARSRKSPMTLDLSWSDQEELLYVIVDVVNPLPPEDYTLFCCFTEDDVEHSGPNGETEHNQVFRRMYPDLNGLPISHEMGIQEFHVPCPLDSLANEYWETDFTKIHASAYVQQGPGLTGKILQAAVIPIWPADAAAEPGVYPFRLGVNYPNPFNPETRIGYSLDEDGPLTLDVYDVTGRLLRTLFTGVQGAGEHGVSWDGRDSAGRPLASGVYFARLRAGDRILSRKMVLAK